jgi:hypothetical protein
MRSTRSPLVIAACAALAGCLPPRAQPSDPSVSAEAGAVQPVALSGLLHIVWNTQPHYFVTDAAGSTTELLLTEEQTARLGGPLQLNGRRVRVSGQRVEQPGPALRVTTIELQS